MLSGPAWVGNLQGMTMKTVGEINKCYGQHFSFITSPVQQTSCSLWWKHACSFLSASCLYLTHICDDSHVLNAYTHRCAPTTQPLTNEGTITLMRWRNWVLTSEHRCLYEGSTRKSRTEDGWMEGWMDVGWMDV